MYIYEQPNIIYNYISTTTVATIIIVQNASSLKPKLRNAHLWVVVLLKYMQAMALKGKYASEKEKEKWMSVMRPEVMSSAEISEDDGEEVIVVHQLPWLTKEVA